MIDNGDGTFTIRNKKTGEVKKVGSGELSKYGLSSKAKVDPSLGNKTEIGAGNAGSPLRGISDALRSTGLLGFIPDAAADIFEIGRGIPALAGNTAGYGHKDAKGNYVSTENPFRSNEQTTQTRNPANYGGAIQNVALDAAGAASMSPLPGMASAGVASKIPALAAPGLMPAFMRYATQGATRGTLSGLGSQASNPDGVDTGRVASSAAAMALFEPLLHGLTSGLLTKPGVARAANSAANEATRKGANLQWGDLQSEAEKEVFSKYGNTPEVKEALAKVLSDKMPASIESLPSSSAMSARDLLDWRRQILARGGSSFFDKLFKGNDIDSKVAGAVRSIITSHIHELAPGTVTPDLLNRLYSMGGPLGGDIPTILRNVLIGGAASQALPSVAGGIVKSALK